MNCFWRCSQILLVLCFFMALTLPEVKCSNIQDNTKQYTVEDGSKLTCLKRGASDTCPLENEITACKTNMTKVECSPCDVENGYHMCMRVYSEVDLKCYKPECMPEEELILHKYPNGSCYNTSCVCKAQEGYVRRGDDCVKLKKKCAINFSVFNGKCEPCPPGTNKPTVGFEPCTPLPTIRTLSVTSISSTTAWPVVNITQGHTGDNVTRPQRETTTTGTPKTEDESNSSPPTIRHSGQSDNLVTIITVIVSVILMLVIVTIIIILLKRQGAGCHCNCGVIISKIYHAPLDSAERGETTPETPSSSPPSSPPTYHSKYFCQTGTPTSSSASLNSAERGETTPETLPSSPPTYHSKADGTASPAIRRNGATLTPSSGQVPDSTDVQHALPERPTSCGSILHDQRSSPSWSFPTLTTTGGTSPLHDRHVYRQLDVDDPDSTRKITSPSSSAVASEEQREEEGDGSEILTGFDGFGSSFSSISRNSSLKYEA